MASSKLIVNHEVHLAGSVSHAALGLSRLLYIANRPGSVCLKTEDDLRLEQNQELVAKLGYVEFRPGAVKERNSGHGLFDQDGIPSRARIQNELKETQSAVITSVVAVRREDAEAMRLFTKQDWERFLRAHWADSVASMGVMDRQDVCWVAAYHVNCLENYHCHVFTWSKSGEFDSLLPKRQMNEAREGLQEHAVAPLRLEANLVRTQARDELVRLLREAELPKAEESRLVESLPAEGSLKYANLARFAPEARNSVDECVDAALKRDERLISLYERHMSAVRRSYDVNGDEGRKLEAKLAAAESDIRRRMGNAVLENVRAGIFDVPCAPEEKHLPIFADIPAGYPPVRLIAEQREERKLSEELASCVKGPVARIAGDSLSFNAELLGKLPTVRLIASGHSTTPVAVGQAISSAASSLGSLARMTVEPVARSDPSGQVSLAVLGAAARMLRLALPIALKALTRGAAVPEMKETELLTERMRL